MESIRPISTSCVLGVPSGRAGNISQTARVCGHANGKGDCGQPCELQCTPRKYSQQARAILLYPHGLLHFKRIFANAFFPTRSRIWQRKHYGDPRVLLSHAVFKLHRRSSQFGSAVCRPIRAPSSRPSRLELLEIVGRPSQNSNRSISRLCCDSQLGSNLSTEREDLY